MKPALGSSPDSPASRLVELERVLESVVQETPVGELPELFVELTGRVERARWTAQLRVFGAAGGTVQKAKRPESGPDRLLSVEEAGHKLGRSKWWVYKNRSALPIVRLPTGGYGFSEKGLEQWIVRRSS